jgi:hypothetical protein
VIAATSCVFRRSNCRRAFLSDRSVFVPRSWSFRTASPILWKEEENISRRWWNPRALCGLACVAHHGVVLGYGASCRKSGFGRGLVCILVPKFHGLSPLDFLDDDRVGRVTNGRFCCCAWLNFHRHMYFGRAWNSREIYVTCEADQLSELWFWSLLCRWHAWIPLFNFQLSIECTFKFWIPSPRDCVGLFFLNLFWIRSL